MEATWLQHSKKYAATCTTTDEDDDSEDDDDDKTDNNVVDDFDDKELEHDATFFSMKRIGYFAHSFQLVAHKFDQFSGFHNLLKQARNLNARVNSSTKATERLIELYGKNLIKDCHTWLSHMVEFYFPYASVPNTNMLTPSKSSS